MARHVTTNLRVRHSATVTAPNRPAETSFTRPAAPPQSGTNSRLSAASAPTDHRGRKSGAIWIVQ